MGMAPLGNVPVFQLFPWPITLTVRKLPGLAAIAGTTTP